MLRRGSRIAVSVLDRALSTPAQEVFHERLLALELRHPVVVPAPPATGSGWASRRCSPACSRPQASPTS